jgi:predicted Zn finger-like uncharacterized protein
MRTITFASSPAAVPHLTPDSAPAEAEAGKMVVSCPVCRIRYLVEENALRGRAGRTVRCASCGHSWHQAAPAAPLATGDAARLEGLRIEPALEVPPRPAGVGAPILEIPPREPRSRARRSRWAAMRWLLLALLFVLAILAGIVVARSAVVAIWPPAGRLYALAGVPAEPLGAGLKIDNLVPARTPGGLLIEGDVANPGKTARDIPLLRVALRDAGEKEVQFKIVDLPQRRLPPGAVLHFKTPFDHPDAAATGVVVTFAAR